MTERLIPLGKRAPEAGSIAGRPPRSKDGPVLTAEGPLAGEPVRIAPGENIVLVVTSSTHRQAAFAAAEFLMDYLKANAPFWKRVDSPDGASWVEARDHDDAAAARWTKS